MPILKDVDLGADFRKYYLQALALSVGSPAALVTAGGSGAFLLAAISMSFHVMWFVHLRGKRIPVPITFDKALALVLISSALAALGVAGIARVDSGSLNGGDLVRLSVGSLGLLAFSPVLAMPGLLRILRGVGRHPA